MGRGGGCYKAPQGKGWVVWMTAAVKFFNILAKFFNIMEWQAMVALSPECHVFEGR